MNPSLSDRTILFLHIPKTAGRTLIDIAERQYSAEELFWADSRAAKPLSWLKTLPIEAQQSFKFIYGHFNFGVHQTLSQPAAYVTLLRDPIDRVLSHYHFVLRSPDHPKYVVAKAAKSIHHYVASGLHPELENGQTRRIAGIGHSVKFGECTRQHLEQAKRNLQDHCLLAGTSERFDETIVLLSRLLGWSDPYYIRLNVNPNRPTQANLPHHEIAAIEQYNQLDRELYTFVSQRLDQQLQQLDETLGETFGETLGKTFGETLGKTFPAMMQEFQQNNQKFNRHKLAEASIERMRQPPAISSTAKPRSEVDRLQAELAQAQEQINRLTAQQEQATAALSQIMETMVGWRSSRFWQWRQRWQQVRSRLK